MSRADYLELCRYWMNNRVTVAGKEIQRSKG